MVLHKGSRNPHTSVMENCKEPHTNVEYKNHTQTLNTKNHRLMKSYGKQHINTPTDQRAWEVRHNLPVNAETHNGGNNVPSREKVSCYWWRTEGIFSESSA